MARSAEGATLTAQHRAAQLRIRAQAVQNYTQLWPIWRGDEGSFEQLIRATVPLIGTYRRLSSSLASTYYEAFRKAERAGGSPTPRLAEPADEGLIAAGMFVTGRQMTGKAIEAGMSPQAAMQSALTRTAGSVTRHVLDGGRGTIVLSSASDREARGFYRVTGGSPCAFCAMLASRGAVYGERTSEFQAHDHCSCAGEPSYEGSEWPGRGREFKKLWNEHATGADNPLNEFRRALEGGAA